MECGGGKYSKVLLLGRMVEGRLNYIYSVKCTCYYFNMTTGIQTVALTSKLADKKKHNFLKFFNQEKNNYREGEKEQKTKQKTECRIVHTNSII